MAYLLNEQILTILKDGQVPEELNSCRTHDKRAGFHIEGKLSVDKIPYYPDFIKWVGTMINPKKLDVFKHVLSLPVETVEFTEGVFDELRKIFEAQDRFLGYQFTNPELSTDFENYLKEIGDDQFWQTQGFEKMKTAINSVVILDLPSSQKPGDRFPRPYYYFLDVQKVKRFAVNPLFKMEYIIFENQYTDKLVHCFDDGHFRTYSVDGDKYTLISEVPHDLGYTPARSFWTTPFDQKSRLQKRGPQSNSLGKFDWLLFLYTSIKHVELYAGFPIDVIYESKCDYRDSAGNACDNGKVKKIVNTTTGGDPTVTYEDCPTCKDKAMLGAGSQLIAPAMSSKDDPDLIQGMNRISADEKSLKYLIDRINGYETGISVNMIGFVAETIREAMNEKQIDYMEEGRVNALAEVRDNFQNIHKFVLETLARLRYGNSALISITCNYGRDWLLQSEEKLQTKFKQSKDNGFATFELSSQFEQILATKYKGNPMMAERSRTLAAIEPFQIYTVKDMTDLDSKFSLNKDLVRLKIDFPNYVSRFEREFMNVGVFMQYAPFEAKVAFIREKLLEYVAEDYPEEEKEAVPAGGVPPGTPPKKDQNGGDGGGSGEDVVE